MATTTGIPRDMDIELQGEPLGQGRGQPQAPATKSDENEAGGYGDTSTQIWKLYGRESENHDKALVDGWKGNTDSMLIFTGLFSAIVAAFLIETYKSLLPDNSSQTVSLLAQLVAQSNGTAVAQPQTPGGINSSAIRVNILMFLSLFFSMTSALVSTLIQQWAREYLQYSQPSAAPHKRGRVRAYLFDGLSRFQMRRLTNAVPVLLHLSVFLFFFALSDWLSSISDPVGATARYCLVGLFSVYMALSILPLIAENAPYQTALTTPLRAWVSLIQVPYLALQLLLRSSRVNETQKGSGLFKSIHVDRSRALMKETKKRASKLDRSAMHWLQQELDEDDMDTFLSGLPGYFHSPLTDTNIVVEGLREDGVPGRIREHFTTCVTSIQLSQDESMSRALACIKSLRLISEVAASTIVRPPGLEDDDIQAIMEYLAPLCHTSNTSTALRASCIRGLVISGFLAPLTHMDAEELRTREFPSYLAPLYRVIRGWKTTEIAQWSQLPSSSPPIDHPFPSDQEMWTDILCDGPLINLASLANTVLSRARDEEVNLDMAWKTLETLLKALGLAQVQASALARTRFDEVRAVVSSYGGGGTQIPALLETLDIAIRGLHLVEVFACPPKRKLPRRRIAAIFGREQLRDQKLLEEFAARLPMYAVASTPEILKNFMERLILEDKLWEQLHVPLSRSFDPQVPFTDKLGVVMAFIGILDVAFTVPNDSSNIDWQSPDFDLLMVQFFGLWGDITQGMLLGGDAKFRVGIFYAQYCHAILAQFSMRRSRGEPFFSRILGGLSKLVIMLDLGTQEDQNYLSHKTGSDAVIRAEAILSLTLRDGPMSNFFRLGRTLFEILETVVPNSTSNDIQKAYALLRRIVDTRHLPLINASEEMWTKFDHLQVAIHGAVALGGGGQNVRNIQPLLDIVDEVGRMRPAARNRAEGTGMADNQTNSDASLDQDARQVGRTPIPGPSSHPETGVPMNPSYFPPAGPPPSLGTMPIAAVDRSVLAGWAPYIQTDPNSTGPDQPPASSIPTAQPSPGAHIPYPYPPYAPPVVPLGLPPPPIRGMGAPHGAASLPPNYAYMQPGLMGMSTPVGHLLPPPDSFPSPSSGSLNVTPSGHVNQGPIPALWSDVYPTPDPQYEGGNPGSE